MMPREWTVLKLIVALFASAEAQGTLNVVVTGNSVELGSSATLTCTLQGGGSGMLEYQWTIGGVVRQPRGPRNTFYIREACVNDSRSDYGCTVYDDGIVLPEVMGTLHVHIPSFTLSFRETTPIPAELNYFGQNVTYLCRTLFPGPLSGDLAGDLVITGPDNTPIEEGSGRVRTSETVINGNAYENVVYFSPLSAADQGNYRCTGTVSPSLTNPLVSNGMGGQDLEIRVFSPDLSVSVSPMATRLLDIPPYNSLTLTCASAITVRLAPVPIAMEIVWLQAIGVNSSPTPIPVKAFTDSRQVGSSSSILTLNTTQSGSHTYSCLVVLNVSPATDMLNRTESVTVEVIGPAAPLPPGNPTTPPETLSHSQATVQWHVAMLSYDPEEYRVLYGTSETNLSLVSDTVSSGDDITRTNFEVSVELTELLPSTTYYYIVESSNTVGTTLSLLLSFNTTDLPSEQVYTTTIITTEQSTMTITYLLMGIGVGAGGAFILIIAIAIPTAIIWCRRMKDGHSNSMLHSNAVSSNIPKPQETNDKVCPQSSNTDEPIGIQSHGLSTSQSYGVTSAEHEYDYIMLSYRNMSSKPNEAYGVFAAGLHKPQQHKVEHGHENHSSLTGETHVTGSPLTVQCHTHTSITV